jgi:phage terminase small subunit
MRPKKPLSPPEQTFVAHFVETGHLEGAAQAAGATPDQASQLAERLLGSPNIQQALQELVLQEGVCVAEAKMRLSHWARGSVAHFLRLGADGQVVLDLSTKAAQSHYHLLHRVVERRYTIQTEQGPTEVVETEIEMYDAIEATHRILQLHGAYPPLQYYLTTNGQELPAPVVGHVPAEASRSHPS